MRTWSIFLYGATAGLVAAWLAIATMTSIPSKWLLVGAAVTLALALLLHQRHVSLRKGRRWRKTI